MRSLLPGLALAAVAAPAAAHHPLDGAPMETFVQGLLSGLGHPVLGADHLIFVVVAGIAAGVARRPLAGPLAYIATMLAGCLLAGAAGPFALTEPMVALSLLALGLVLAAGRAARAPLVLALFAVSGLFHGTAFGITLTEQEAAVGGAVLGGYLLGLGAVQYALAAGAAALASRLGALAPAATGPRLAGAAAAGAGLYLSLGLLVEAIVA